ncbi:MAG: DUF1302 domain-containing protein [Magnetococcales bacterium]|nr:DUF1302 domain-containing protein [Magnetococcales bacterium]
MIRQVPWMPFAIGWPNPGLPAMVRHGTMLFAVFGFALTLPVVSAQATDLRFGDGIGLKFSGTLTVGSMIRTESPDPSVLGMTAAKRVGLTGQLNGNTGNSDLNFRSGQPVSSVLKANLNLEIERHDFGIAARAEAWHDYTLENGDRPYGNIPNGFQSNVPLSDHGFAPEAQFSNLQLEEFYLFGKFDLNDQTRLDLRFGRQVIPWGVAQWVGGGINIINPFDHPAQQRPGALPQESRVPLGMLYANLSSGKEWGLDGFLPYEFRPNVMPGCGTFFATVNYAPTGCNYASVIGSLPDSDTLATGMYPKRGEDEEASNSGQYGISLRHTPTAWNTEWRAYLMNYHNRAPGIRIFNPDIAGGYGTLATRLTDPNGLRYAMIYPENVHLYGVSFATSLDSSLRIFGELAYRPNQPVSLNASDLIAAFVARSPTSALNLTRNSNAIPPGGTFDGYDRFSITTASLGANKTLPATWGAERLNLGGEIGWSHVEGLPNPGVLHYGRSDAYGIAAINGQPCTDTSVAQKSCAHDGFVTTDAWGYRLRLSASFPDVFLATKLTPSLMFSHDVKGYSYDGTFLQDRTTLRPGLRADWDKNYFAEMQYTYMAGGAYNMLVDRDNIILVIGTNF